MATNSYFSSNYHAKNADQTLIENLIVESIQIYGIDISYMPRSFVALDTLFGEDALSTFNEAIPIEMYIKSVDGFGGENEFLSKFGIEVRDEITLTVTRRRFKEEVTDNHPNVNTPREGDLIHLPTVVDELGRIFEISFVEPEEVYYQAGNLYTYELRCRLFEYDGEDFDTGDEDIDIIEEHAISYSYNMANGTGDYIIGEVVYQDSGFAGEVVKWDEPVLSLKFVSGSINTSEPIIGENTSRGVEEEYINHEQRFLYTLEDGSDSYTIDDTIRQISGFTGVVKAWNDPILELANINGSIKPDEVINGDLSGSRLPASIYPQTVNPGNDSNIIDDGMDWDNEKLIDFSESDPWSEGL